MCFVQKYANTDTGLMCLGIEKPVKIAVSGNHPYVTGTADILSTLKVTDAFCEFMAAFQVKYSSGRIAPYKNICCFS